MCTSSRGGIAVLCIVGFVLLGMVIGNKCFACNCGQPEYPWPFSWKRTGSDGSCDVTASSILRQYGQTWFHIVDESTDLKVTNVHDYDYQLKQTGDIQWCSACEEWTDIWNWVQVETDYHDCPACSWSGPYLQSITAHSALFYPTTSTSSAGVCITWKMRDRTDAPYPAVCGNTINDEGPFGAYDLQREIYLGAWEAKAKLAVNTCRISDFEDTGWVFESSAPPSTTVSKSITPDEGSHIRAWVWYDVKSDEKHHDCYASATWSLGAKPSPMGEGGMSEGHPQLAIGVDANGTSDYDFCDNSAVQGEPHTLDLAVGLGLYYNWKWVVIRDESEGQVLSAFAFESENGILGNTLTRGHIEDTTGWHGGGGHRYSNSVPWSYAEDAVFSPGDLIASIGAQTALEARVKVEVTHVRGAGDSNIFNTGTVEYSFGKPTWVHQSYQPPDEGFND